MTECGKEGGQEKGALGRHGGRLCGDGEGGEKTPITCFIAVLVFGVGVAGAMITYSFLALPCGLIVLQVFGRNMGPDPSS